MNIEHAMQEHHRGVRERLGMTVTAKPVLVPRRLLIAAPEAASVAVAVKTPKPPKPYYEIAEDGAKWRQIILEVCNKHEVTVREIGPGARFPRLVAARHEAVYRMREETNLSYAQIGMRLGGFDHCTIVAGYRRHVLRMKNGTAK